MKKLMEAKKNLKVKLSQGKKLLKQKPKRKLLEKAPSSLKEAMLKMLMKEAGMMLKSQEKSCEVSQQKEEEGSG